MPPQTQDKPTKNEDCCLWHLTTGPKDTPAITKLLASAPQSLDPIHIEPMLSMQTPLLAEYPLISTMQYWKSYGATINLKPNATWPDGRLQSISTPDWQANLAMGEEGPRRPPHTAI
jgi:hypothetical protein